MSFLLTWVKSLGLKVWAYALLIILVLYIIWKIYQAGRDKEKIDGLKETLNSVIRRNEIEKDVDGMSRNALIEQLRKSGWLRSQ